jgi:hypothetical protein
MYLVSSLTLAIVQGFFSFRIYAFSKKLYIPVLSWVMSVLRVLGCTALFVVALDMKSLGGYLVQWKWLVTSIWSVSTANDLMITATLVVLLRDQRTNVHRRYDFCVVSFRASLMSCRTAALVKKLILWSTGLSKHWCSRLSSYV